MRGMETTTGIAIGDLPTWILALVSVAALFAAFYAGSASMNLLRVEQRRDEQARQISAWASPSVISIFSGSRFSPRVVAIVNNPTNLPIYDVKISWEKSRVATSEHKSKLEWVVFKTDSVSLVAPGSKFEFKLERFDFDEIYGEAGAFESLASEANSKEDAQTVANRIRISISFFDASKVRWLREGDGNIEPISKQPRWRHKFWSLR